MPHPTFRRSQSENTPQVTVADTETLDFGDEAVEFPESAYQRALSSFSQDEREKITKQDTIKSLFQQLNEADHGHQDQSLLRKGLKAVKPYLERLNATIDFISPFASMEPAAGTALGLVKGSASIAIAICGRFDDMTKDIAAFLERIPAIDRCSDVVKGGGPLREIYHALVNVYKDLLQFYLKTVVLFEGSHFALAVALDILKPEVADIVSSFKADADLLSKLLEAESFASIQEIKDEQIETLIRDTLERDGKYEWSYHNELQRRTDDACSWVTSNDSFSYWLLNSRDSNLLALFGDMGSGKTMTTAFVADALAQRDRPLAAYYCKDEHESAKLGNIYRSILRQFIRRKPDLKLRFWDWYKKTSQLVTGNPTQSDDKLRELLYDIISSSKEPVFIVLDALDECKPHPRKQLFSLFQDLFNSNARLKVFISSRYDDDIEADLPSGVTRIELRSSKDRDHAIATYLVAEVNLPSAFHAKAVEELAARSHGSAIWLRIAVEYIASSHVKNEKGLQMALDKLPSSKGLAELYGKLFGKICEGIPDNEALLQHALEILAVARRPLTLEELAYAVFTVNPIGEDALTLGELGELADSVDLLDLLRPFISASGGGTGKNPQLRLVHQSLKELVLTTPPSEWCSGGIAKRKNKGRGAELDANLLDRCIRYLLFDECGEGSLFPNPEESDVTEFFAIMGAFAEEEPPSPSTPINAVSTKPSDFNPSDLGLGGFYAYAAAYWTSHFSDVLPERRPDPQQLITLCQKDSRRLENWVDQWRRPSCSYIPEHSFGDAMSRLDPLTITAMFGPAESVSDLFRLNLDSSVLTKDSAWTAVNHLVKRRAIPIIKRLVLDETLQPILCTCKFLYAVIPKWWWSAEPYQGALSEWEEIFGVVISRAREDLLDAGNDVLCRAANSGCLALVKKLFSIAEGDAELRQAILRTGAEGGRGGRFWGPLHLSIGEAAYGGHADVVRFLCEQPGLESHLRYVNQEGHTVFHQAARSCNEEVFRALIQHWPEGVDIRNKGNDTPLVVLIFNKAKHEESMIKLVRLLLHEGKTDATGRSDDPGYSPLCTAVRGGYTMLLRVLIVEGGADVWQAVGVDEATGRPSLLKGMDTLEDGKTRDRMLKVLCSLLPLTVSVDCLWWGDLFDDNELSVL
ncbi:hypothetical protein MFIFM68171_03680 [Madurella fahalii]|uniref:Nephrocystin 3-like N-terminal domain-containing protein n=1 Tax=Madurella fahalii TaxID=1157608 RepID=A0ABQ0G7A8_9PEZI